ncbi:MAG TPA: ABC transporter permease [Bryobacteraceae bacterium]|jgi:predicted permease
MPRLRTLLKNWKLSGIAIFSLAIALALGVFGLGISNWILLRPPAAADPGRLVTIYQRSPENPIESLSYLDYKEYRDNNSVFSGLAAFPETISKFWVEGRGEALGEVVSDNYFSTMGMQPVLGRLFSPGADEKKLPEVVLSYACWKRWGSDPNIVGQTLSINDGVTIVGVAPREFTGVIFGISADVISLVSSKNLNPDELSRRDRRRFILIGRLKPRVSRKQASGEMQALAQRLAAAYPQTNKGRVPVLTRAMIVPPDTLNEAELVSAVLMILALLVILVACANVANLLLALAVKRRQETTIKAAIGATRRRLIFEFIFESMVLCAAGGLAGFFIATLALRRISQFSAVLPLVGSIGISANVTPDAYVAVLAGALVLVASLATGLPPALYASSPNLAAALSGEIVIGGRRKGVIRNALAIVQVSVCTLVLVGLGLCLRSFENLRHIDPGFVARNVLAAFVGDLDFNHHSESQEKQIYRSFIAAASQIPGVESVSLVDGLPFAGGFTTAPVELPGENKTTDVAGAVVDDNYFATLGVPIFSGRAFDLTDRESGPESVVVNRKLAEMFWPNRSAVGQTLRVGKPARQVVVVGVAGNGKYNDLDEAPRPFLYYAFSQHFERQIQIVVRTRGDPRLWAEPLLASRAQHGHVDSVSAVHNGRPALPRNAGPDAYSLQRRQPGGAGRAARRRRLVRRYFLRRERAQARARYPRGARRLTPGSASHGAARGDGDCRFRNCDWSVAGHCRDDSTSHAALRHSEDRMDGLAICGPGDVRAHAAGRVAGRASMSAWRSPGSRAARLSGRHHQAGKA